ncbi:MAG: heavy metal-binding domain-containing protein [Oscillospiraceae bacterium]|nr:heavy metal-binding domain-containing protein [Oscillospiraceae bacterium]
MQLYTTDFITGKNLETIGLVTGGAVQTKHVGQDFMAAARKLVGGEVNVYSRMQDEAQAQATLDMMEDAKQMGADAVVCVRYSIASIAGSSKVLACGTAVKFV